MRKTSYPFMRFSFFDRSGMERYLEKQADKGWLLEKVSAFGWKFRSIEPQKLRFAVAYFPQASAFDPEPSDKQLQFQDFCEHTGWVLAAASAQMQIYYNQRENPIPIDTDPVLEVENLHRSMKKMILPTWLMNLVLALMQLGMFFSNVSKMPAWILSSNASLFGGVLWVIVLALALTELGGYYIWYFRARARARREGEFLPTRSHMTLNVIITLAALAALGCMLTAFSGSYMIAVLLGTIVTIALITAVSLGISALMKRMKVSGKVNRNATIVLTVALTLIMMVPLFSIIGSAGFGSRERVPVETYEAGGWTFQIYHDALPLTVEDLMDSDYQGYSYEAYPSESFLMENFSASQEARHDGSEEPGLDYTVNVIKFSPLYDYIRDAMLNHFAPVSPDPDSFRTRRAVDAGPWGAEEAWQLYYGQEPQDRYLLCYADRILEISLDWTPDDSQKAVVCALINSF